ncbi:MAG: hypothetical protein ACPG19_12670, partial [Saprospiraceae bacterium]
ENEAKFLCIAIVTEINFNEVIGNILSKSTDTINLTDYLVAKNSSSYFFGSKFDILWLPDDKDRIQKNLTVCFIS